MLLQAPCGLSTNSKASTRNPYLAECVKVKMRHAAKITYMIMICCKKMVYWKQKKYLLVSQVAV